MELQNTLSPGQPTGQEDTVIFRRVLYDKLSALDQSHLDKTEETLNAQLGSLLSDRIAIVSLGLAAIATVVSVAYTGYIVVLAFPIASFLVLDKYAEHIYAKLASIQRQLGWIESTRNPVLAGMYIATKLIFDRQKKRAGIELLRDPQKWGMGAGIRNAAVFPKVSCIMIAVALFYFNYPAFSGSTGHSTMPVFWFWVSVVVSSLFTVWTVVLFRPQMPKEIEVYGTITVGKESFSAAVPRQVFLAAGGNDTSTKEVKIPNNKFTIASFSYRLIVKKIRVIVPPPDPANPIVTIKIEPSSPSDFTLSPGQEIPVFNEEILESPGVKKVLQEGKIEIID